MALASKEDGGRKLPPGGTTYRSASLRPFFSSVDDPETAIVALTGFHQGLRRFFQAGAPF